MNPAKSVERFFQEKLPGKAGGFPIATNAHHGPDNETATKGAVGIVDNKDEVIELNRWLVRSQDVRIDRSINGEILLFIKAHSVKRVAMAGKIIGCPHEEGIDYPEGATCPHRQFWMNRDRWTGRLLEE